MKLVVYGNKDSLGTKALRHFLKDRNIEHMYVEVSHNDTGFPVVPVTHFLNSISTDSSVINRYIGFTDELKALLLQYVR